LIYLYFYPRNYKTIFIIAFIPGILSIITSLFLKESSSLKGKNSKKKIGFFSFLNYWKSSDIHYKKLVVGLLLFALINSSDVFLLLKAKESGMSEVFVIGLYIFYNLMYAIFAFPLGRIADKMGIKTIYIIGLICFSMAYFGIALSNSKVEFISCFIIYGIFSAATEGISKAWLTSIVAKENIGTAIGFYTGFQSICTLLASSFTGLIWYNFGSLITLSSIAFCAVLIAIYFLRLKVRKNLF
jgi:MFS family permease